MPCFVLSIAACGGRANTASTPEPRGRRDLITADEIRRSSASSAYDLVSNLRPQWLTSRGPDSITRPSTEVQVVLDGVRAGGIEVLRSLSPEGMVSLQFVDGLTASTRWGLGFGAGAIVISTRAP